MTKKTIIYIHGFLGSGKGTKARIFREYFKNAGVRFIAPSLSYVPDLAVFTLEELIENYGGRVGLIGSSLGGFYAIYLSEKYNLKTALINPAIEPSQSLRRALGRVSTFYDNSYFEWKTKHLDTLKSYQVEIDKPSNFLLLAQKGDELLDYSQATTKLAKSTIILEEYGSHRFDGIDRYLKRIAQFIN